MGLHPQGRQPLHVTNIHIKNGRLIDPKNRVDAKQDVFIADGKIAALGKAPAGFRAERTINASNLAVCPGLIDLSARLREPGFEYKATLASEMQAAVAGGGVAHDGEVATRLGLQGIPAFAETIALATILQLVRATRTRVHLCRLSTAEGVAMLREAKKEGLPVSGDASAHHAHLSEIDLGYFDSHCHVIPPFRSLRDRDALRSGLADGTIDALCSDHAPVDDDAKQLPHAESEPGVTGLELLLPLSVQWAGEG